MKTTIRIIFASALAFFSISPAFAGEDAMSKHASMTNMSAAHHHASAQRIRAQQASEANAYAPSGPAASEGVDFSIGSQR